MLGCLCTNTQLFTNDLQDSLANIYFLTPFLTIRYALRRRKMVSSSCAVSHLLIQSIYIGVKEMEAKFVKTLKRGSIG